MNTPNPYAPPQAAVRDIEVADGYQPVRLWSARGRIGRLRYLAHLTGAYVLIVAAGFAAGVIAGVLRSQAPIQVVTFVAIVAYLVFFILKTIQRSHDMDWSGWSSILALIPLVNLVWVFKGGTAGTNRHGSPPPPNTLGVKVLGLVMPVIVVIGIVAAIALPAYVHYSKARSVQVR